MGKILWGQGKSCLVDTLGIPECCLYGRYGAMKDVNGTGAPASGPDSIPPNRKRWYIMEVYELMFLIVFCA
jgi:hypothetical protein